MSIIEAIVLGVIQGLTEFLPISSSAHLTLAGKALGLVSAERPEQWTSFIAVLQLGTLAAVLLYYSRDIVSIVRAFFRENVSERKPFGEQSLDSRLGWFVIIGTLPIGVLGFAFKKLIEGNISKDVTVIASGLIALAAALAIAERVGKRERGLERLAWRDALVIGFAQALALLPGPSRSGTTITAGLFMGLRRDVAARFSFLLSIPAVLASGLFQLKDVAGATSLQSPLTLCVATVAAGVSGYAAIAFLIRYLQTHSTMIFVAYRILLGAALLAFFR